MKYKNHFEAELEILKKGLKEDDHLVIEDFIPEIQSILEKFGKQGHSGMSAGMYANVISDTIKKVLLFKPLSPLTGEDSEWNRLEYGDSLTYQNKRLGGVFKEADGRCKFVDAIVWQGEEDYDTFTGTVEGIRSSLYIKKWPFTPKTFYVDVYKDYAAEEPIDKSSYYEEEHEDGTKTWYMYRIKHQHQLDEVANYYDLK